MKCTRVSYLLSNFWDLGTSSSMEMWIIFAFFPHVGKEHLFQKDQQIVNPDFQLRLLSVPVSEIPGNVESTASTFKLPWNIITATFWKSSLISTLNSTNFNYQLFDSGIPFSCKTRKYKSCPPQYRRCSVKIWKTTQYYYTSYPLDGCDFAP